MTRARVSARVGSVLAVAVMLAFAGVSCNASERTSAPAYSARDRTGDRVSIDDLRGAPALLTSWATWCKECKDLLPALEQVHVDQGADGLQVVSVNVNAPGSEDGVVALERQYGMSMARWRDVDNDFTQAFRSRGVPTSVLLDADGAVVRRWPGGIPLDDPETQQLVKRALRDARR